jgi:hypothetical protein
MKKIFELIILIFPLIFSMNAFATPQKIEMIFLSPQKVSQLLELIDKKNNPDNLLGFLAQADQELKNCVPMGDGCFDPQLGYIEKKPDANIKIAPVVVVPKDSELQLKTFNAVETSLVNCDKGNYFDIYCGKEKAKGKPAEIEIWFDISSSLRTVDYNKDPDHCNRRSFMTKVMEGCKDKVRVSVYNTSLKEVGDFSSVCLSYGTNDEAKLLQWMKASEAKTLVLVTDIDEMSQAMKDFLSERGAKMIGDGVKPFSSTDLVNYANDFVKTCKK